MACCPYGSKPAIVLAQVLSVISLILTIDGFWFTWFFGLIAMILLLCLACAFVNRGLVVSASILAILCAIGQFVFAAYIRDLFVYCNMQTGDYYSSQQQMHEYNGVNSHMSMCNITTWRIVAIVAGVGWLLTSLLACCILPILKEYDPELRTNNSNSNTLECAPVTVAYGVALNTIPTSSTETFAVLPDGTKRTEIVTINSDGSKTITVTDEHPNYP